LKLETEQDESESEENEHSNIIIVKPTESRWLIVDLKIPDGTVESGSHQINFDIQSLESKETVSEKSIFLVPR